MTDEKQLSPVERMALSARSAASEEQLPYLKPLSFRVPLELLASIDAFSKLTGQSRNTTMINLLEAGIYAVGNELDDPEEYHGIRSDLLAQYLEG